MNLAALALLFLSQSADAGMRRACARGVTVTAIDAGPSKAPVTVLEATTFSELAALNRDVPVLTPAEAQRIRGTPELVITLHVHRRKPDEVVYVVRAELLETGTDANGQVARVVVWQAPALSGLTSFGSEKSIVSERVSQAAASALRECKR